MKTLRDIPDLHGKKVLLRVDFDVPIKKPTTDNQQPTTSKIAETFRIKKQKETIDYLLEHGAHVTMIAHISAPTLRSGQAVDSFKELVSELGKILGHEISFYPDRSVGVDTKGNQLGLLDNIRQNEGEEKNDSEFALNLSKGFDLYINNAFAVCHREHASVSAITKFLPSYAGLLIEQEVSELNKIIEAPKEGKVVIMGGAKASTKVPVIKHLIDKAETVLVGGVVANDMLKENGQDMGSSVVDADAHELLNGLDLKDSRLVIPKDFIVFDNKILDIGDETMRHYMDIVGKATMIVWNGPLGLFENPIFAKGTNEIAQAIVNSSAFKVIGGGDTISAVDKINLLDKFDFVSTGGGAMLAFLAGEKLPGLEALK